ncbi:g10804 [Coccomyxa viridis]|uniref:G10804 protein n=1 Tax=Coccomyxa viridis TaxID=1274662 RepID=A0ABP1G7J6_9CHLO
MGGLTNGIGYVAAALTVGWLLKSTDYISYKIDERRSANKEERELVAMALQARRDLNQHSVQTSSAE